MRRLTGFGHSDGKPKKKKSNVSSGGNTEDLTRKYFALLSKRDIQRLFERYRDDFEAFGYTHEEYLELGKEDV